MKKIYRNITDILRLNRFIVLAVVILCLLTSGLSLGLLHHYQEKLLNSAFAIGANGTVVPLKLVDRKDKREVEALAHIDRFHRLFYGIDGVYNRLVQFSLRQQIDRVDIELDLNSEPYGFKTRTLFEVHRGTITDRYQLDTSGKLITVDRNFPHNPHGLLIIDFYEDSLRKLEPQTK